MYQALYRKYRPNNFDDVVGQQIIVKSFKNAILQEKLSHAYLFTGPRGTGKTTVAKIIGKTVNCANHVNAIPCNDCVNCTQINNKESTDIIEIDAASNNGIDEIRELKSKVNLVPSNGKYKVYIIDEVHMLTVGAFNALLKTLEEPPAHVLFILATTEPHKIPITILSRCQRFDFKKLSVEQIVERLRFISNEEKIEIEKEALYEIARLSDGGLRDSISLFDQTISYVDSGIIIKTEDVHEMNGTVSQRDLQNIINSIFSKDILTIFNEFDKYNSNGKSLVKIAEEILLFLRNVLLYKTVPNYFTVKEIDTTPYELCIEDISIEEIICMIDTFNENIIKMKVSNTPKMIFELTIIKMLSQNSVQKKGIEKEVEINKVEYVTEKKELPKEESKNIEKLEKSIDQNIKLKLKELKKMRINNTLSNFQRKKLVEMKEKQEEFRPFLLNPDYNEAATLIIDSQIKAASDTNVVFMFEKEWVSDYFNQKLLNIEKLFEIVYQRNIKAISCNINEWEQIKKEFNSKSKKYEYKEENISLLDILGTENNKNEIDKTFSDIIEYSN